MNKQTSQTVQSDISPPSNKLERPNVKSPQNALYKGSEGGRKRHPVWGLSELSVSVSRLAVAAPCWPWSRPGPPLGPQAAVSTRTDSCSSPPPAQHASLYRADSDFELRRGRCGGALGVRAARKSWWANNYCSVSHSAGKLLVVVGTISGRPAAQTEESGVRTGELHRTRPIYGTWQLGAINNFRIDPREWVRMEWDCPRSCVESSGLLISTEKGRRIPGGVDIGPLGGEQVVFSDWRNLQIPAALNLVENQCDGGAGVACVGAINAISAHLLQSDGHQALLMATDWPS